MKKVIADYLLDIMKNIEIITLPVIAGIVKHILFGDNHSLVGLIRDMIVAGLGGYFAYLLINDVEMLTDGQKSFIYGIIGLSAEIIFRGVVKLIREFVDNPIATLKKIKSFNKAAKK